MCRDGNVYILDVVVHDTSGVEEMHAQEKRLKPLFCTWL